MPLISHIAYSESYLAGIVDSNKDRRTISGVETKLYRGTVLRDGFQQLFEFRPHKLEPRGTICLTQKEICCDMYVVDSSKEQEKYVSNWRKEQFLSWDSKSMILWQHDKIVKKVDFPMSRHEYISSIIYLQKLNVFIAATTDFKFEIYDKNLSLVESIQHEERAILSLEYNFETDSIVVAGAQGLSIWRAYRHPSMKLSHILEKMFGFPNSPLWLKRVMFEFSASNGKIYAMSEGSVYVFDLIRRCQIALFENIHQTSVTAILWYDRSQFYVTASDQGEIKCFSAIFNNSKVRTQDQTYKGRSSKVEPSSLALLHTFNQNSRAVTGLILHPSVPGLMISASIDGFIRVLNLEALDQLFEVNLRIPILNVKMLNRLTYKGMLLLCSDGSVKLWKIVSCCKFFGLAPSEITLVTDVFNFHFEDESGQPRNWFVDSRRAQECLEQELLDQATSTSSLAQSSTMLKGNEIPDSESSLPEPQNIKHGICQAFISFSNQDFRLLSPAGSVLCHLEPEDAIQGIRSFTISLYQELLFCLIDEEATVVKIYDIGNFKCPLIATKLFRLGDQDQSSSMCLVDSVPYDGNCQRRKPIDALNTRGHLSMGDIDEVLIIGMYSGVLVFLDTLNDYDTKLIIQAHIGGPIDSMVYRNRNKELFTLGVDIDGRYSTIKIWKLPEMKNTHVLGHIALLSYWLPSPSMGYIAIGAVDGALKLYMFSKAQDKGILGLNEVQCDGQSHDAAIVAISFCDEKGIIATCASDNSVMFWNYRKNHLKTIVMNNPMRSLCSQNADGDILVTQRCYMLSIPRSIWDVNGTAGEVITEFNDFVEEADRELFTEKDAKLLVSLCAAKKSLGPTGGGHKSVTFITSDDRDKIFRGNVFIGASNAISRNLLLKLNSPREKEYFSMSKIPVTSKRVYVFNTRHPRIQNIHTERKEDNFRNNDYCLTLDSTTEIQTTISNSIAGEKTQYVATVKHKRLSRPDISKRNPTGFLRDRNGLTFGPEHQLGIASRPLIPRSSNSLDLMRQRKVLLSSNDSEIIISEEEESKDKDAEETTYVVKEVVKGSTFLVDSLAGKMF